MILSSMPKTAENVGLPNSKLFQCQVCFIAEDSAIANTRQK